MFQFRAFPSYTYLIQYMIHRYCLCVFPHSEISGSQLICSSPKLIAACHVLHRLLMPRHSPCALISLTWRQRKLRFVPRPLRAASTLLRFLFLFDLNPFHWASNRSGLLRLVLLNYAGFNRSSLLQNCIYPNYIKVPQCFVLSLRSVSGSQRPLLPCFFFSSVQFSRCISDRRSVVENSGIEPLTS